MSSPSRDTQYERTRLPSVPRLPESYGGDDRFACIGKIHVFVSCFVIRDRKHTSHRYHGYRSDFRIGPEMDPVWTQFSIVGSVKICKCLSCLVDLEGFEPSTSSMPWKRAPNCATGPWEELSSL